MSSDDASFKSFVDEMTGALNAGDSKGLSPEALLFKVKFLYPGLFVQMEQEGVLQYLEDPEKLRAYLRGYFEQQQKLPEQAAPKPEDIPREETKKWASDYDEGVSIAERAMHAKAARLRKLRQSYIHRLVENYKVQSEAYYKKLSLTVPDEVVAKIRTAERIAAAIPPDVHVPVEQYVRQIQSVIPPHIQREAVPEVAIAQTKEEYVHYSTAQTQYVRTRDTVTEARRRILASPTPTTAPSVIFIKAIELAESTPPAVPESEIVTQAETYGRVVEIQRADTSAVTFGGHNFFQTIAKSNPANVTQKVLAPAADFYFDRATPSQQADIVQKVFSASVEEFKKAPVPTPKAASDRTLVANALQRAIQTGPLPLGITSPTPITGAPKVIFEKFAINVQTVEIISQFKMFDWINTQNIYSFIVAQNLKTTVKSAGKIALKEGVEAATKKVAGKGVGGLIGAAIATVIPVPGVAQALGYIAGEILMDKVIHWGGKILGGISFFLSGGMITAFLEGKPESLSSVFLLFPVALLAFLGLFLVLPWVGNLTTFSEGVRDSAFVTSMGSGDPNFVPPPFTGQPIANGDITACPTSGGELTQCPSGSFSHGSLNAYDIALGFGAPVRSSHPGVVSYIQHSNTGYGNLVIVKGRTPQGVEYTTYYAHLAEIHVSPGDQIPAGTLLGLVDSTGNSTGNHLHYEYRQGDAAGSGRGVRFLLPSCGYTNPLGCSL